MADQGGWNVDTNNYTGEWDQNGWEDPYAGQTQGWGQQQTIMPTGNLATAGGNWTYDQFGNLIPVQQLSMVDQLRKKHGTYGKRNPNTPNTKAVWERPEDECFLDPTDKAVLTEHPPVETTTTRTSTGANHGAAYLQRRKDELTKRMNKIEKLEDQIEAQRAKNESILAKMQEESKNRPKGGPPPKSILKRNTTINTRRVSFGGDRRRRMSSSSRNSRGSSKGRSSGSSSRGPSKSSGRSRSQASQSTRGRSQASKGSQGRPSKGAGRNGASRGSQGRPSKGAGRNGASRGNQGRPSDGGYRPSQRLRAG